MRYIQISNFSSIAQSIQYLHPFEILGVSGNFDKKGVTLSNGVHVKRMQYFSCVRYNIESWQVNQKRGADFKYQLHFITTYTQNINVIHQIKNLTRNLWRKFLGCGRIISKNIFKFSEKNKGSATLSSWPITTTSVWRDPIKIIVDSWLSYETRNYAVLFV